MSAVFPLHAPHEAAGPLRKVTQLGAEFETPTPELLARLAAVYGEDEALLRERREAAEAALWRFLEMYGDQPCALYRVPARISLNPHSDHQGAWVPYGLHARELLLAVSPDPSSRSLGIVNTDPTFTELLHLRLEQEITRAPDSWNEGWLPYIESAAVTEEVQRNRDTKGQARDRRGTLNYVKGAALRLEQLFPNHSLPGLRIALHGDIPQGGGQSSSSALVVGTALALAQMAKLPLDRRELAERCGEAEWYVGTRGGSGDQAAMLLGSREGLVHLCFRAPVGIRDVRLSAFPDDCQLILANSQTRSEKSAEERLLFNRGVFAYRFAFLALKEAMRDLGLPEALIGETESLGDLHTGRLEGETLYRLVLRLPEHATPAELAARFPRTFGPAARGCFGTDDPARLPAEIPLRGAAVYGLGRVDRGRVMPELLQQGEMEEFGRLMSITHDGDRLFQNGQPYTESRERLSDPALQQAMAGGEALRCAPGFYGASVAELDRMVDVALRTDGVLGAGLMGAGGGGYVLILARGGSLMGVREALTREYYQPAGKEPDVEPWRPTAAAGRLA